MTILNLETTDGWLIDPTVKGFTGAPLRLKDLRSRGLNVLRGDTPMPVCVLRQSSLDHNRRWMKRFLAANDVKLCPHGKTTMSPQLFEMQLEDGAWGLTCASVEQLLVYRHFGVNRVIMANQLVGRTNISAVVRELERDSSFTFYCLVDSLAGVEHLSVHLRALRPKRSLSLLIEIGSPLGRTGARSKTEVLAIAEAIRREPHVTLAGLEAYEGAIRGTSAEVDQAVSKMFDLFDDAVRELEQSRHFEVGKPIILTAGGSDRFDFTARRLRDIALTRPTEILLRSGCYLTHDHLMYERYFEQIRARKLLDPSLEEGLKPALEVWGLVQSRPEPTRAFVSLGKRDISYDFEMPMPIAWYRPGDSKPQALDEGFKISRLNDQHAFLELPASARLAVGDFVCLGISHPCTTFDKWQLIYVVDDAYNVIGGIRTFF